MTSLMLLSTVLMRKLEKPADFVYKYYRDLQNLGDQIDAAVHGAHEDTGETCGLCVHIL